MKKNNQALPRVLTFGFILQCALPLAHSQTAVTVPSQVDETITVGFLISSSIESRIEQRATLAGDPSSSHYGRYASLVDIDGQYRPRKLVADRAKRVLLSLGYHPVLDPSGLFLEANMSVAEAGSLAGVTLIRHQDGQGRWYWAPDRSPTLPVPLRGLVESLMGLDQTPHQKPRHPKRGTYTATESVARVLSATSGYVPFNSQQVNSGTQSGCMASRGPVTLDPWPPSYPYTPNQWLHAYGIDQLHAKGYTGAGERLALIEIDGFFQSDLDGYTDCFGLKKQVPYIHTIPEGSPSMPGPGGETILDLQMLSATAPGLDRIDIFEDTSGGTWDGLGKAMLAAILQPANLRPTVISISIGGCEAANTLEGSALFERANRRAAALGISVLVSTGDQGATACSIDMPWGRNAASLYSVQYPASSPWVTAVGGTNLRLNPQNEIVEEIPWNNWVLMGKYQGDPLIDLWAATSGTSAWFKQPEWQRGVGFDLPAGNLKRGRIVPDVALLADSTPGYAYFNSGEWQLSGGTSAATPLMAGGVAVMNQGLRAKGQSRLGYLNPLLYRLGHREEVRSRVYQDVTSGNNDTMWQTLGGYGAYGTVTPQFMAIPGFDGVTGWGSPDFISLFDFLTEKGSRR